jgi:hypothetical protein
MSNRSSPRPIPRTTPTRTACAASAARFASGSRRTARSTRCRPSKAEIFAVGNFFTPDECGRLMAIIDAVRKPSRAFDVAYASGHRTSYSGDVDPTTRSS